MLGRKKEKETRSKAGPFPVTPAGSRRSAVRNTGDCGEKTLRH